jgi:hypothetical protein
MSRKNLTNELALKRAQRELDQYYGEIAIHESKILILREKIDRLLGLNYNDKNACTEDIMLENRLKRIEEMLANFGKKLNSRQQLPIDKRTTENDKFEDRDTLTHILREQIKSRQRDDHDDEDDESQRDDHSSRGYQQLQSRQGRGARQGRSAQRESDRSDQSEEDERAHRLQNMRNDNMGRHGKVMTKKNLASKIAELKKSDMYGSDSSEDSEVIYNGNDQIYDI